MIGRRARFVAKDKEMSDARELHRARALLTSPGISLGSAEGRRGTANPARRSRQAALTQKATQRRKR